MSEKSVESLMYESLQEAFTPESLIIIDDSARHAGHREAQPGGETHFKVEITASAFAGKPRVARHRMVYAALKPLMNNPIHALQIDAKAPGE